MDLVAGDEDGDCDEACKGEGEEGNEEEDDFEPDEVVEEEPEEAEEKENRAILHFLLTIIFSLSSTMSRLWVEEEEKRQSEDV